MNVEVGGVEGVESEFANSLWSSLSSIGDECMVCDDSVVTCTCIILLDGYCLLVNSGGVERKLINHYGIS